MKRRKIRFILAVFLICLEFGATFVQAGQKQREQQEEETRQKLMEDMELGQMQDAVNQILKEDSFSIEEILNQILKGESLFQKETMSKSTASKRTKGNVSSCTFGTSCSCVF